MPIIGEITPTLFVGLGGAGTRVVSRIAQQLKGRPGSGQRYNGLAKFVTIDTDASSKRFADRSESGIDASFLIADFNKRGFAQVQKGGGFNPADPYFTQWCHDAYNFRGSDAHGAGQIRIESRLGLYYNLTVDTDLRAGIKAVLDGLSSHHHAAASPTGAVRVQIVFSVAGGTGSGTFLPMAYLLKDLAAPREIKLTAYALQPKVFEEVLGLNLDAANANAYAALKELEHFNHLEGGTAQASGGDRIDGIEFHYDAQKVLGAAPVVHDVPFGMTYLVDSPEAFTSSELPNALADAIFFRTFSPIGDTQTGDVDNYERWKEVVHPGELATDAKRGYRGRYGALGTSVLHVPDDDILLYCALRCTGDLLRRTLLLADPELVSEAHRAQFNKFTITEEKRKKLSALELKREVDRNFARKLWMIAEPFKDQPGTVWGGVATVRESVAKWFDVRAKKLVEGMVPQTGSAHITTSSVDTQWNGSMACANLLGKFTNALKRVETELTVFVNNRSEGWWADFLQRPDESQQALELNPYQQRFAAIALKGLFDGVEGPLSDEKVAALGKAAESAAQMWSGESGSDFGKRVTGGHEQVVATAPHNQSLFRRTLSGDEVRKNYEARRAEIVKAFQTREEDLRSALVTWADARIRIALANELERVLQVFREIEMASDAEAQTLSRHAQELLRTGKYSEKLPTGQVVTHFSESNQYTLDVETLQAEDGTRLWDWYFLDQVRPSITYGDEVVQAALKTQLAPTYDGAGRVIVRSGGETVQAIARDVRNILVDRLSSRIKGPPGKEEDGLRVDQALALEAVYLRAREEATLRNTTGPEALRSLFPSGFTAVEPAALWSHPDKALSDLVTAHAQRKIEFAIRKADSLAWINREAVKGASGDVPFADNILCGAHALYHEGSDQTPGFARLMRQQPRVKCFVGEPGDWYDRKRIVFFSYTEGLPLYAFPYVVNDAQLSYRKLQNVTARPFPLHIEKAFDALPDLDPLDLRKLVDEQGARRRTLVALFGVGALQLEADGAVSHKLPNGATTRFSAAATEVELLKGVEAFRASKPVLFEEHVLPMLVQARTWVDKVLPKTVATTVSSRLAKVNAELATIESGKATVSDARKQGLYNLRNLLA